MGSSSARSGSSRHFAAHRFHLFDCGAAPWVDQELLDPGRFRDRVDVGVDEERPEQHADMDVRERAKSQLPAR